MTTNDVNTFLDRLETDPEFASRIDAVKSDPTAVRGVLVAEGFDLDPFEVREAFLERFGAQLTEEQLALVAGGLSQDGVIAVATVGMTVGVVGVVAIAAAAF